MGFCSSASKPFRPKQGRVARYIAVWLPLMLQDASENNNNSQNVNSIIKHFTYMYVLNTVVSVSQQFDHKGPHQVCTYITELLRNNCKKHTAVWSLCHTHHTSTTPCKVTLVHVMRIQRYQWKTFCQLVSHYKVIKVGNGRLTEQCLQHDIACYTSTIGQTSLLVKDNYKAIS